MERYLNILKIYTKRPVLVMMFMGFPSGLPLALTASTLFTWLADVGIDKTAIGLFALIAIPYSLKFLWSPVIDSTRFPLLCALLGRRRGWLMATQLLVALAIAAQAMFDPLTSVTPFAICALLIAFMSASQDIVIDAYRVESMDKEYFGAGAAMYSLGYRLAMLISGAGALALAQILQNKGYSYSESWQVTYVAMALFMAVGIVTTLMVKEPPLPEGANLAGFSEGWLVWLKRSVIDPFADFMTRPGWLHILLFVLLYRLADAFLGVMFNPFVLNIGFTKLDIAHIVKVYGMLATLAGGFIGGVLVYRFGIFRTLFVVGILHMFTNLMLVALAGMGPDKMFLALCIVLENSTAAMGSSAFIAYLSSLCKINYTATQYALLSSLAAVARTQISALSGKTSDWFDAIGWGWEGFFTFSSLLTIPALLLLLYIHRRYGVDALRETGRK